MKGRPNHVDREDLYTIIIVYINESGFRKGCPWKHILMKTVQGQLCLKEGTKKNINQLFPTAFLVDVYGGISRRKIRTLLKINHDF